MRCWRSMTSGGTDIRAWPPLPKDARPALEAARADRLAAGLSSTRTAGIWIACTFRRYPPKLQSKCNASAFLAVSLQNQGITPLPASYPVRGRPRGRDRCVPCARRIACPTLAKGQDRQLRWRASLDKCGHFQCRSTCAGRCPALHPGAAKRCWGHQAPSGRRPPMLARSNKCGPCALTAYRPALASSPRRSGRTFAVRLQCHWCATIGGSPTTAGLVPLPGTIAATGKPVALSCGWYPSPSLCYAIGMQAGRFVMRLVYKTG
jgi:hypothetical protein